MVLAICEIMDEIKPNDKPHKALINDVEDRPGHDKHLQAAQEGPPRRGLSSRPRGRRGDLRPEAGQPDLRAARR